MKDGFPSNMKLSGNKLCVVMLGLSLVCVLGDEIFITARVLVGVRRRGAGSVVFVFPRQFPREGDI